MTLRRVVLSALITTAALALSVGSTRRALADDETNDVAIKIRAPIDDVNCDPSGPTVTVLGLTVGIGSASFSGDEGSSGTSGSGTSGSGTSGSGNPSVDDEQGGSGGGGGDGGSGGGDGGDGDGNSGSGSGGGDDNGGQTPTGCALSKGQMVEVKLANDTPPLTATEVHVGGGDGEGGVEVKGPIQNVDATNKTLTILALVIDVSTANTSGADDDAEDGNSQAIDLTQLMNGQFAEVKLDASKLPALVATELQVMNFSNQVEVEVDDSTGQEVDDMDSTTGQPDDDVSVTVTDTTTVQNATGKHRVRKVVTLRHVTNGSFALTGLPTGQAKITVTRNHDGVVTKGRRTVRVRGNTTRPVRLRLRSH